MSDYFKIPRSLESNEKWISYSLKRRALFLFLVSKAVFSESHLYKGINLTYGQYLTSYGKISSEFNLTVTETEDKIDRSYVQRTFKKFQEDSFINYKEIDLAIRSETLITITDPDTYELIKNGSDTDKSTSDTVAIQLENNLAIQSDQRLIMYEKFHSTSDLGVNLDDKNNLEKCITDTHNNSFKHSERYRQQEQQEQNKDFVYERQCLGTLPFLQKGADSVLFVAKKFKLTESQIESFRWLIDQNIDSSESTLSYWSKEYSLERLKDVHIYAKKTRKKSVGALMNSLLMKNAYVENSFSRENKEFAIAYKQEHKWHQLRIEEKYITCEIKGVKKEIPLSYSPDAFVDTLVNLYKNG